MKKMLVLTLALMSFAAFAGNSVQGTIEKIEFEKNVKCELVKNTMGLCLGQYPYSTCYRTAKYLCLGAETLKVKLKIKEFYNVEANRRDSVVTKITKN